jgi:soluble lytic murein transglycosylase
MRRKVFVLFACLFLLSANFFAQQSDAALRLVIEKDKASRDSNGNLMLLTAEEHLLRADIYMSNRLFPQAREHWQKYIENFPNDAGMAKALFGMGRSLMWERKYAEAITWFEKLSPDYLSTKEGREGLNFKGACYVRLGKNPEAVRTYEQYTVMFPFGERIDSAHLNIIDALREAGKYDEAIIWVNKTRARFSGLPTETNALHARLRMEIYRQNWTEAIKAADDLLFLNNFRGSMASLDEVRFLKGFALEKAGRRVEAIAAYQSIPDAISSYYGSLASEKLTRLNAGNQLKKTVSISPKLYSEYPIMFRAEILRHAKTRGIDPRFILAIMKQESGFRPNAKSPAAARGLLQLVYDTALKYSKKAGFSDLQPDDLYLPNVNIAIGSLYIADLKDEFGGLYEAIAASYNGGEDNAARWLKRSRPKEAGIFASEIGFAETKNYVFKVMGNYRAYRELYTEDLLRK